MRAMSRGEEQKPTVCVSIAESPLLGLHATHRDGQEGVVSEGSENAE